MAKSIQSEKCYKDIHIGKNHFLTTLQFERVFFKIENTIDDIPLDKGNTFNDSHLGFEYLLQSD